MLSMVNLVCFSVFLMSFSHCDSLFFYSCMISIRFWKLYFFFSLIICQSSCIDIISVSSQNSKSSTRLLSVSEISDNFSATTLTCCERHTFAKWFAFPQDFSRTDQLFKCPSAKSLPHLYLTLRLLLFLLIFFSVSFCFFVFSIAVIWFYFILDVGFTNDNETASAINELVIRNTEVGYWLRLNMIALLSTSSGELAILIFEMKIFDNSSSNVPSSELAACAVNSAWNASKISKFFLVVEFYGIILISSYALHFLKSQIHHLIDIFET